MPPKLREFVYRRRVRRGAVARNTVFCSLLVLAASRDVRAAPRTDACLEAFARFQTLRDTGDLVGAKRELAVCGAAVCPNAVQRECVDSLGALEPRIPTVVVVARNASKRDVPEVAVFLDDKPWRSRLDGREAELNPGLHKFRFETAGHSPSVETFLINEREKGRRLEVELPPLTVPIAPPAPPKSETPAEVGGAPMPAIVYVLGGVGAGALGTSAVFGIRGLASRLEANKCSPNCSSDRVDDVNRKFLVSDISFGIALVALAAATFVYLSRPKATAPPSRR